MKSAIYSGWVSHRRFWPKRHGFKYRVFMMFLNLSELDAVLSLSPLWSTKWWSPARFRRADFHGDPAVDLNEAVKRTVAKSIGRRPEGDVCMLANLRYFGINMNPLCTYYCYDKQGQHVEAILAEVTNTPWHERRAYVLDCQTKGPWQRIRFDKDFTVSPFNTLDMHYAWRSSPPGKKLSVHIDTCTEQKKITDASLRLVREELNGRALGKVLTRFPFMTAKIAAAIYWQALRLFLKGVPFLGKNKISKQLS